MIVGLTTTSDGFLLACHEGDVGFNHFVGTMAQFQQNWDRLLDAADLTPKERQRAQAVFASKVLTAQ
jgi:hypothetical protein